jgi:hypothetical protein
LRSAPGGDRPQGAGTLTFEQSPCAYCEHARQLSLVALDYERERARARARRDVIEVGAIFFIRVLVL